MRRRWGALGDRDLTTACMIRSELIARLAELYPELHAKDAKRAKHVVHVILDALSNTLSKGGRVEIRGFGSFESIYRPPRQRRNPRTGEKLKVPGKYVPRFKVGKELRERVIKGSCHRIATTPKKYGARLAKTSLTKESAKLAASQSRSDSK